MREFSLQLSKALQAGLRAEIAARNSPVLTECTNLKPQASGLVAIEGISNPFASSQYSAWPLPQLFKGPSQTLLVGNTSIKSVTEGSPWTATVIPTYNANDPTAVKVIPGGGGVWHLADFGKTWFLFSETSVVFKTGLASMFGDSDSVLVQDAITMKTGCAHRGRLVTAGFNPADYWSVDWDALLDSWKESLSYSVSPSNLIGENFVMWSTIGGGDLTNIFLPRQALNGMIPEDRHDLFDDSFFMDLYRRNELGLMPMPFSGTIYAVKPLGKAIVVYGEHGIALIYIANVEYPTYGMEPLLNFGIKGRGAVSGDDDGHIFVDEKGNLWNIDLNYKPQRLGYKEYISPLSNIVVTHTQEEDEYYIGGTIDNQGYSYILSPNGLARNRQLITSIVEAEGKQYGVFLESGLASAKEGYITTEVFDFRVRDLKTVTTIEIGGDFTSEVYVAVDYRYDKEGDFSTSNWVLVNKEGFARVQITAVDFRLKIKIVDSTDARLDGSSIHWQVVGKRTIRGPYVDTLGA